MNGAAEKLDGALDQCPGNGLGRIGPASMVRILQTAGLGGTLTCKGIDRESIADLGSVAVQVDQQRQVFAHGGARARETARRLLLLDRMLKAQQRPRIELVKAREAVGVHPAHERAQVMKVAGDGRSTLWQSRRETAGSNEREQSARALQQRSRGRIGEVASVRQRKVPSNLHRVLALEGVGRTENPPRVVPAALAQEPGRGAAPALLSGRPWCG